ncbi:unnamed protein product [Camellia sinensis]
MGRALGKGKGFVLDNTTWVQAHREHREFIKRSHRRLRDYDVDRRHNDESPKWFNSHVVELLATENVALSDEIKILALGPSQKATRFNGYIINGTRYHTRSRELRRQTQNSGVMVKAKTSSYGSAKDINPVEGDVTCYGYVTDIIELYYSHDHRYMLFMCNWIDNNKGLKRDDFGFTLVNFNHLLYTKKRDNLYEVCGEQPTIDEGLHHNEVEGFGDQELDVASFTCEEDMDWVRQGIDGTTIDETIGPLEASTEFLYRLSMSSSSESSSSESEQSSSNSSSSDETHATLKMRVIPDPPASWHPPGSLPTTSRGGSTSHGSVSAGPSSSQATQKQTRGPTYVHGQWGTNEDGVLKVVSNELNQVVEGYTSLASHLGVLARDGSLAPLTFTTWHYVLKQNKDNIWTEIKAHTDADESMKRTIMASFGKKWRDWKSRMKTMGYKPFKNDAERLKSSKKNRKIRKKKTLHHRTGWKPFSVVRLEETKKNNGVPASRSQVWMAAYMKDGTSNSDSVNEVMHMEGSSTDPAALQEKIFTQVMGLERPGPVRTFGLGPSPTDVFGGGYRLELTRVGGKEVHKTTMYCIQNLAKAFSSYEEEVLVKQEELLQYGQGAIAGLKLNSDIARIDFEVLDIHKILDGEKPKSPQLKKQLLHQALKEAFEQVQLCSRLEELLLKKKLLNNGDSPEIHAKKRQGSSLIICVGILTGYTDTLYKDLSGKTLLQLPKLYGAGHRQESYNMYLFWITMIDTLWQSLVLFYVLLFTYRESTIDIWGMGSLVDTNDKMVWSGRKNGGKSGIEQEQQR